MDLTEFAWPLSVCCKAPVAASQSRTVRSEEPSDKKVLRKSWREGESAYKFPNRKRQRDNYRLVCGGLEGVCGRLDAISG